MQSRAASELGITKLLPQKLSEMFLPVSLEIDLPLRIADKANRRRTRYSSALLFFGLVHFLQEPLPSNPRATALSKLKSQCRVARELARARSQIAWARAPAAGA